jgi:hypothetical protein
LQLPAIPCDVVISNLGLLLVLLPAPYYLQAFQLSTEGNAVPPAVVNKTVESFQQMCLLEKVDFFQRLDSSGNEDEDLKGMQKHVLDKRFNSTDALKSNHFNSRSHRKRGLVPLKSTDNTDSSI